MIHEIEVLDKVRISDINKILYEYTSDSMPKRNSANMFSIRAVSKKNPDDNNDEADIRVSAKPLKVNIDQDTLMFLMEFFSSIATSNHSMSQANASVPATNATTPSCATSNVTSSPKSSPVTPRREQKPIASGSQEVFSKTITRESYETPIVEEDDDEDNREESDDEDDKGFAVAQESLDKNSSEKSRNEEKQSPVLRRDSTSSNKSLVSQTSSKPPTIYVKSFRFCPDVPIRLDYTGKRVNLDQVCSTFHFDS